MYSYPETGSVMYLHIFFQKFKDRVIIGHHPHRFIQYVCCKRLVLLLTARSMPAAVVITLRCIAGSAAAGIAKFHRGRAGFTVAGGARAVPVLLTTRAGVFGSTVLVIEYIFLIVIGCAGDWFSHDITGNFCGFNYSYAHKSFKGSHHTMKMTETSVMNFLTRHYRSKEREISSSLMSDTSA
jgi:hypothetical protein